jgi:hypothetical protein
MRRVGSLFHDTCAAVTTYRVRIGGMIWMARRKNIAITADDTSKMVHVSEVPGTRELDFETAVELFKPFVLQA